MGLELYLEIVYENNLDMDKFARMFNNKAQSYKFYWFQAILNLTKDTDEDLTFEEIIDEMILFMLDNNILQFGWQNPEPLGSRDASQLSET